ncbi:AraC family transcriptional regulator [Blastopirellula sp. JC732]|uniref:AraC family transcriptional regulator n=1 Tax=Blastopirellula sediminis TaxID=2894196 RepID=A0A9X1MPL8_9BACT|nr:AraC family transcriptional regulator [Blastopirellula sediminis]MCC9606198.1 AraC family transcriptional regulator [Blastopirellula sediminis]MCC9630504.1 AraC family transcriptional regulator [Blastopirellula sediminis]
MSNSSPTAFKAAFFARNPMAESVISLFKYLPQTYFYAKDTESRFVTVNRQFLENHGLDDETQALGKSDYDFHPPLLAEAYISEDRRVMASRQPLPGQVWQVLYRRTMPRWYVCTKAPLFDASGEVIGIAGAMYRIEQQEELSRYLQELLPVARYVEQHYAEPISVTDMAAIAGLSSTHFNRRFQQLLRVTPTGYLQTVRIQAAQRLLSTTSRKLAEIAVDVGFTDQSHFTKRFREVTGLTPAAWRKRFVQ